MTLFDLDTARERSRLAKEARWATTSCTTCPPGMCPQSNRLDLEVALAECAAEAAVLEWIAEMTREIDEAERAMISTLRDMLPRMEP